MKAFLDLIWPNNHGYMDLVTAELALALSYVLYALVPFYNTCLQISCRSLRVTRATIYAAHAADVFHPRL